MIVFDKSRFGSNREIDSVNGYLRVEDCNITKVQVRPYLGREVPCWQDLGLESDKIYNVFCPAEELEKAVNSFDNIPLTRDHIAIEVDNVPKERIVGSLGDHARFEYPYLKNNLIVYDKKDIDNIMNGKRKELSCGYRYTPVRESGVFEGQRYDFKMTNIIGNHVAIVKKGRAGSDVMVADSSKNLLEVIKEKIVSFFDNELVEDEFVESEHPRDDDGKFTKSTSGSSASENTERPYSANQLKKMFESPEKNKDAIADVYYNHLKKYGGSMQKEIEAYATGRLGLEKTEETKEKEARIKKALIEKEEKERAIKDLKLPKKIDSNTIKGVLEKNGIDVLRTYGANTGSEYITIKNPKDPDGDALKISIRDHYEHSNDYVEPDFDIMVDSDNNWHDGFLSLSESLGLKSALLTKLKKYNEIIKGENKMTKDKDLVEDEFKESEHPRDKGGKFTSAGGSGSEKKESKETLSLEVGKEFKDEKGRSVKIKKQDSDGSFLGESEEHLGWYSPDGKAMQAGTPDLIGGSEKKEESKAVSEYREHKLKELEDIEAVFGKESDAYKEELAEIENGINEAKDYVKAVIDNAKKRNLGDKDRKYFEDMVKATKESYGENDSYYKTAKLHLDLYNEMMKSDNLTEDKASDKIENKEVLGVQESEEEGEKEMTEEDKEEKVEELKAEEKPVEEEKSLEEKKEEITEEKKVCEEPMVEDEPKEEMPTKEEKEEKSEEKKKDEEPASEEEPTKDACGKKEMAKDSALVMDADAIRAEGREQGIKEAMEDYKAREVARKAVRKMVGDVDVFAFDSADEIYKFACEKSGMDLEGIVSFKDAFRGLQSSRVKLTLDASPISGSNEECLANIRVA